MAALPAGPRSLGFMWLGRLDPVAAWFWILSTGITLGWVLWGLVAGRLHPGQRQMACRQCTVLVVPVAALVAALLAFGSGAHPLVQYNNESTLGVFRLWGMAWPVLLLGLLVSGVVSILLAAASRPREASSAGRWLAILVVHVIALYAVFANFPSV